MGGKGQAGGGGGRVKANLIFFAMGGCGGFKTNLNKKVGRIKAIFFL